MPIRILANADNDFLTKVVSIRKSDFQKSADETDQEKEEMRKQEDHYLDIIKWNNIYG